MPRKVAGEPAHDLALPSVEIAIAGVTWHLCFTIGALSLAKKELLRQKIGFNVLVGTDIRQLDIDTLPVMLYAGLVTAHPEITDLRLPAETFYAITPRQLGALLDRRERATAEREFLFAQVVQHTVNFSMGRPEKPASARDFMPSEWRKPGFRTSAKPKRVRLTARRREAVAEQWRMLAAMFPAKPGA